MSTMTSERKPTKQKPGRRPVPQPVGMVVSIRGRPEWRDWVNELAEHCRVKSADLVDHALIRHAQAVGFAKPAPRRT